MNTSNVVIVDHPLAQEPLAILRDKNTEPDSFRRVAHLISLVLIAEAMRDVATVGCLDVLTPLDWASGRVLEPKIVAVPVLRAGLGMLDAMLELVPQAKVGHIGLQRNELTAVASQYYLKLPPVDLGKCLVVLLDPMLATGGSAAYAVDLLKKAGVLDIRMVCIVAAPEGVALMAQKHPDVKIYTPVIDKYLNDRKYIIPGLGDFGDRLYGTE